MEGQNYLTDTTEKGWQVYATDDVEIAQRALNEKELYKVVRSRIYNFLVTGPYAEEKNSKLIDTAVASVLCYFAFAYWGNNKLSKGGDDGIMMKIRGRVYNLSRELGLVKIEREAGNDTNHNPEFLTASRIARVAVLCAYYNREGKIAAASPLKKKVLGMTDEAKAAATEYLQVHGYLLPLKITKMTKEEKIACLGINFYVHYTKTKQPDVRRGLLQRFQNIMTLTGVESHLVVEWMQRNKGAATAIADDSIAKFFANIDHENAPVTDTSDVNYNTEAARRLFAKLMKSEQ